MIENPNVHDEPHPMSLSETTRIEAFSDGVFAIAITLLILEIHVPTELPEGTRLGTVLLQQGASYVSYLAAFATIGIMWINHHRVFNLIRRADNWLLVFNLLLLLGITFLPFPTILVADYLGTPDASTAMAVYAGNTVVIAIFYNLLWRYAAHNDHLLDPNIDMNAIRAVNRGYLFGPLLYSVAFVFAFISVPVSLAIVIGLALFFALPPRNLFTAR